MADQVEITITSHPRWLRLIRQAVLEFARQTGFDSHDSQAITLAVGEAVGNVIKHAYKGSFEHQFVVRCNTFEDGLEVEIRDEGEPFELGTAPDLAPEELRVGGRGLYLMRAIMDEIDYCREGSANVMRMRKRLKQTKSA